MSVPSLSLRKRIRLAWLLIRGHQVCVGVRFGAEAVFMAPPPHTKLRIASCGFSRDGYRFVAYRESRQRFPTPYANYGPGDILPMGPQRFGPPDEEMLP